MSPRGGPSQAGQREQGSPGPPQPCSPASLGGQSWILLCSVTWLDARRLVLTGTVTAGAGGLSGVLLHRPLPPRAGGGGWDAGEQAPPARPSQEQGRQRDLLTVCFLTIVCLTLGPPALGGQGPRFWFRCA